jgi:two-component system cell cycle sensor histidine kinase/response regulator CckA
MAWVLIVDDDEMIRDMLQKALHGAGYAIVRVGDGEDALEVLRATPYHAVVLLDVMMPGMNGPTMLAQLADDPELAHRHAWVVMSANHGALQHISAEHATDDLALVFLRKPFTMDNLLATVAQQAAGLPPDMP